MRRWLEINWLKFQLDLTPVVLRKKTATAWLKLFFDQIKNVHSKNKDLFENNEYQLNHTGQIFSLEKMLNDNLDNGSRSIKIETNEAITNVYIYQEPSKTTSPTKDIFIGTDAEDKVIILRQPKENNILIDFTIKIPSAIYDKVKEKANILTRFYLQTVTKFEIREVKIKI